MYEVTQMECKGVVYEQALTRGGGRGGRGWGWGGRSGVQRSLSPPSPASPSAREWTAVIKKHTTKVSVAGL